MRFSCSARIFGIGIVVLFCFLSFGTNCYHYERTEIILPKVAKMDIEFDRRAANVKEFGLTGEEPLSIGLGISAPGMQETHATFVTDGNVAIEVPTNVSCNVRAAIIVLKNVSNIENSSPDSSKTVAYYSTAEGSVLVDAESKKMRLQFAPFKMQQRRTVTGVMRAHGDVPAAGAEVEVIEPFSGAIFKMPGERMSAIVSDDGSFIFDYFFPLMDNTNRKQIGLRIVQRKNPIQLFTDFALQENESEISLPTIDLSTI